MQLSFAILLPIVALASGASAAECFSQGKNGNKSCVDNDSLWQFRQYYCNQEWQGNGGTKDYNANNGFTARFLRTGAFANQQQCWDSTNDIISTCFGRKDGGTWSGSKMELAIRFCS